MTSLTMPANAFDILDERGLISAASDAAALRRALERPVTFYVGFDPSAASLTAGHLVPLMMARHLQQAGHRPILIAGGGTGLIGDPSDRLDTRALLTEQEVTTNVAAIRIQVERFVDLGPGGGMVLNNADWLKELGYLAFLRDIGRHFSVNEILATDTYRKRLDDGENLNFIEINYRLLQAYDFLHLKREYGCTLQIAGSDQWANILAGVDLIRRVERTQAFGLVAPLLTTADGAKMGKTAAGRRVAGRRTHADIRFLPILDQPGGRAGTAGARHAHDVADAAGGRAERPAWTGHPAGQRGPGAQRDGNRARPRGGRYRARNGPGAVRGRGGRLRGRAGDHGGRG